MAKTKTTNDLPNLTDDPQYAAASARLADLRQQLATVERDLDAAQNHLNLTSSDRRAALVEALQQGRDVPDADMAGLHRRVVDLRGRRGLLAEAIDGLAKEVAQLGRRAGQTLLHSSGAADRLKAIIDRKARLVAELATLDTQEADLAAAIEERGIPVGSMRCHLAGGSWSAMDNSGFPARLCGDLLAAGIIDKSHPLAVAVAEGRHQADAANLDAERKRQQRAAARPEPTAQAGGLRKFLQRLGALPASAPTVDAGGGGVATMEE